MDCRSPLTFLVSSADLSSFEVDFVLIMAYNIGRFFLRTSGWIGIPFTMREGQDLPPGTLTIRGRLY